MFAAIIIVTVLLQVLFVEFGGSATVTSSLSIDKWFGCIGIASISLPLGAVVRMIPVPKAKQQLESDKSSTFTSGLLEESVEME